MNQRQHKAYTMFDRRDLLKYFAASGIGTAVFHRAAAQEAEKKGITAESLKDAEWISGIELSDEEREELVRGIKRFQSRIKELRGYEISHTTPNALHFQTLAPRQVGVNIRRGMGPTERAIGDLPESDEAIAFLPVTELSQLIRTKRLSSTRLTKIYLERLKKYGPTLRCVVNLTEELGLEQAARADKEIAAGRYRGPLHGIPWGAKDLVAVPGYPTTWGIPHFRDRVLEEKATVATRLEEAGAVLVAKLSLGAIAMGDKWFGGLTRSPWDAKRGSSGSSAGSASSTVAGLVGFSIGSETLGSIISPSRRCGASGFRPTFGRVSRFGCMPLSWSMDKIGPICRSIEDCALVFGEIHGADGLDPTALDAEFSWPTPIAANNVTLGYTKSDLGPNDREELRIARDLGCKLVEIELPMSIPLFAITNIIDVEGASVFDKLLREGHTEGWNAWKNIFRSAQYTSAIDYLRCQRARHDLMVEFESWLKKSGVDFLINANDLFHTNLTGHPSLSFPISYKERNDTKLPSSVLLTGHLNDDARLLAFANAYQGMVDAHLQQPPLEKWKTQFEAGTLDKKPEVENDEEAKPAKSKGA